MPKVLRIINRLNLGGPTYNVAYLSKYLAPEFETLILAGHKDEHEASSEFIVRDLGLEPVYINGMYRSINPFTVLTAYPHIKKIIKDYKPDIVHTHAAKAGALGRIAAAELKVPIIIHTFHGHVFHSYFSSIITKFFIAFERFLAKKTTKIVTLSEIQKKELSEQFKIAPANKFEVIPLGFDLERFQVNTELKRAEFRKKYSIKNDEIAIGIIGRLAAIKNHELFLRSLDYLRKNTSQKIRAFIIGDGDERKKIKDIASMLNIDFNSSENSFLTFTSWIYDVSEPLAGLDIVALTSFNEGTPVSLIEAQAAKKPIVTTNAGGIANVVIPRTTALLAEFDEKDFGSKLLELINDKQKREAMGEAGAKFVQDKFSYKRLVKDMRSLYLKLLEENRNDL